jgi:hypothetical protein
MDVKFKDYEKSLPFVLFKANPSDYIILKNTCNYLIAYNYSTLKKIIAIGIILLGGKETGFTQTSGIRHSKINGRIIFNLLLSHKSI